ILYLICEILPNSALTLAPESISAAPLAAHFVILLKFPHLLCSICGECTVRPRVPVSQAETMLKISPSMKLAFHGYVITLAWANCAVAADDFDLVIYGGTSGGISAAIQAARLN